MNKRQYISLVAAVLVLGLCIAGYLIMRDIPAKPQEPAFPFPAPTTEVPTEPRDTTLHTLREITYFNMTQPGKKTIFIRHATEEEQEMSILPVPSMWMMTSPFLREVNATTFENEVLSKLRGIRINTVTDDGATDLNQYGLDSPQAVIEFGNEAEKFMLRLGRADGNSIYAQTDTSPAVFTVLANSVTFKDLDAIGLINRLVYVPSIGEIAHIEIDAIHESYILENEFLDNNKDIYQKIIGFLIHDVLETPVTEEPSVIMTFTFNNDRQPDILKLMPVSDRFYAISVNDKAEFVVEAKQVKELAECLNGLIPLSD